MLFNCVHDFFEEMSTYIVHWFYFFLIELQELFV